jgi:hypothetical protein
MILNESMKKTITLKESELISLIERMVKEAEQFKDDDDKIAKHIEFILEIKKPPKMRGF